MGGREPVQKKYTVSLLVFWAVILILQPPIQAGNEQVTLKERFKAGQSFKAVDQLDLQVQIEAAEITTKIKITSGLGYRYTVKRVAAKGGMTVGMAVYSIFNEMPGETGQNTYFDSTDPLMLPKFNDLFSVNLVGQEIEMEIEPGGRVGNVKFSDAFLDRVLRYSKKDKTPLTKEQLQEQVLQSFGDRIAKPENSLEQGVFPGRPVAVGESWNKQIKLENNGLNLDFQVTYTLKQRLDGIALITVTAKLDGIKSESGDGTYEYRNLTGWLKGMIAVIETCGWMRDFDIKFGIDGEAWLKPTGSANEPHNEATSEKAAPGIEQNETDAIIAAAAAAETVDHAAKKPMLKFHVDAAFNRNPLGEH
jgi:hypothetical protein